MPNVRTWVEVAPAAYRVGISVRAMYDAVDQGLIQARWVGEANGRRLEVAVDDESVRRLSAPGG